MARWAEPQSGVPEGYLMKIEDAPVDGLEVPPRHRASLVEAKVTALVESISAVGLLHPIMVYTPDDGCSVYLVAGAHRLEAARRLGWDFIPAIFIETDEIDRELAEIDENLCRAELTEAEEAAHLKRRQELWEARRRRETETGGTSCSTSLIDGRAAGPQHAKGFAAETAAITGESKQSINRKIARAEKIAPDVLEGVRGTELDKGVVLDTLKKLDHDEQRQAVQRVKSGADASIKDAYAFIRGEELPQPKTRSQAKSPAEPLSDKEARDQWLASGMAWWNRGSKEWREEFLARIDRPVFDHTRSGHAA